jgi:hypothetical protein
MAGLEGLVKCFRGAAMVVLGRQGGRHGATGLESERERGSQDCNSVDNMVDVEVEKKYVEGQGNVSDKMASYRNLITAGRL